MTKLNALAAGTATLGLLLIGCETRRTTDDANEARYDEQRQAATTAAGTAATQTAAQPAAREGTVTKASVQLKAADGQEIEGEAELESTDDGVRIVATVEDAKPGKHGIHVHEKGDCSNIAGKSMGDHFAPSGQQHALPAQSQQRHLGDLGNIEIADDGTGRLEITVPKANLNEGDAMSFLGKALVVHMGEDSGQSKQPAGDSGDPIACGVIEKG